MTDVQAFIFVSRLTQSCASQVLSALRCKKEVCNMHAHALRKGTGAYGHFCPSPLQDAPSVYPTPCGRRQRDWALPQVHARSSYHAQRNLSHTQVQIRVRVMHAIQYACSKHTYRPTKITHWLFSLTNSQTLLKIRECFPPTHSQSFARTRLALALHLAE